MSVWCDRHDNEHILQLAAVSTVLVRANEILSAQISLLGMKLVLRSVQFLCPGSSHINWMLVLSDLQLLRLVIKS